MAFMYLYRYYFRRIFALYYYVVEYIIYACSILDWISGHRAIKPADSKKSSS